MLNKLTAYHKTYPPEQVYLHFDKPYYSAGDTIWFKAYVTSNGFASALSSKLYIEMFNDSSRMVEQFALPVNAGLASGYIALPVLQYKQGTYVVRAYTKWQQNFGESVYFYKNFSIGIPRKKSWLVSEQHVIQNTGSGRKMDLALKLTRIDKVPVAYQDVLITLSGSNKAIIAKKMLTSGDGSLRFDTELHQGFENNNIKLSIADKNKQEVVQIPIILKQEDGPIDLQFMPEGGHLINGLYTKIGFKAIGEDGLGVNVKGHIINSANEEVANFQSSHLGMGSFLFAPKANETYRAVYTRTDGGKAQTVTLAPVKPEGITFKVNNISSADTVLVYVYATPEVARQGDTYYLMSQNTADVFICNEFSLKNAFYILHIPKRVFTPGLVQFAVLNAKGAPLMERLVYMPGDVRLNVKVAGLQQSYQPLDSIPLQISITDHKGEGVTGSFSVAVTDDSQVKHTVQENILTHLLLASQLKGNIEQPEYYMQNSPEAKQDLDNLLLTQGWTAFNWQLAAGPLTAPSYPPEPDNRLSGRLTGMFKKPVSDAKITLFFKSNSQMLFMDTVSNQNGEFNFTDLPNVDTAAYVLKLYNSKHKALAATVELNEFKPSPVKALPFEQLMPWNVATDSTLLNYYFGMQKKNQLVSSGGLDGNVLKEVVIKAKKKGVPIGDDFAFTADEITTKELIAARRSSLADLLYRRLPEFKETNAYCIDKFHKIVQQAYKNYTYKANLIVDFVIDGVSVWRTQGPMTSGILSSYNDYLHYYLNAVNAEEVTSIKVLEGLKTYIVISTRSGKGPWGLPEPGTYVYRPLPVQNYREFYRPRYKTDATDIAGYRSTLHWEPNLVTGNSGKASFSFYAADKPGTYTIKIEGTDLNGRYAVATERITIGKASTLPELKTSER
ncbi:hypothetical protein [Mucilaginibacter koreensis]